MRETDLLSDVCFLFADTTDGELRDLFAAHGSVDNVVIPKNRDTGTPRGFAFVDMSTEAEVDKAVVALHETEISGRKIRVQKSLPKDQAEKQTKKFGMLYIFHRTQMKSL